MTSHPIVEFGYAVKTARLDLEMSLTDAAVEILGNGDRKGYVSQIEKGTRNLSPETIDKFAKYLGLDADVVKAAHQAPPLPKVEAKTKSGKKAAEPKPEDQVDFDAERLLSKARRDENSPQMGETLMIALAYEFAGGQYRDLHTAYSALRGALEAAGRLRAQGDLRGSNAASHLDLVLADVAKLNEELRFEEADALFDVEEKRMREAHKANEERQVEEKRQLLERRLDQDRLQNNSKAAAERLIADLRDQAKPIGLFWATDQLSDEWREKSAITGDMFENDVALELAKANYRKAKNRRNLLGGALYTLGNCHSRVGSRSSNDKHLNLARTAYQEAIKLADKKLNPDNWSMCMEGWAHVTIEIGERAKDPKMLEDGVGMSRAALDHTLKHGKSESHKFRWDALGIALMKYGEYSKNAGAIAESVDALERALSLKSRSRDPIDWEASLSNLAVAQRFLGEFTEDLAMLHLAQSNYAICDKTNSKELAPFMWAIHQWNIADLLLAQYRLEPVASHLVKAYDKVTKARAFFVDGSDYQTQRCDELLNKIEAAEAA